jgi:hypothetical protein
MTGIGNVERVRKLLRLLSSPQEAEVAAAVRALMRTLEADGADIHALADSIGNGKLSEADMRQIYDAAYSDGKRAAEMSARPAEFHSVSPPWHDMAVDCRDNDNGRLSERERKFVDDMVRWTKYREPTEKQQKWLHVLWVRTGRRRA